LAVIIGNKAGSEIPKYKAFDYVGGYALALDMTARNLQRAAAKSGDPWDLAKGFDSFCPIGEFIPKTTIPDPSKVSLWCKVDGKMMQNGNTKDMIFDIPFLIEYCSKFMTLEPGDVILTGTPEGVGPVVDGQVIECGLSFNGKQLSAYSMKAVDRLPGMMHEQHALLSKK
jgi:acylpyruvate hydrolase